MQVDLQPGKYVVAVSGGVDSVALLDMLVKLPDVQVVVAHFDHGIRPDSAQDRNFVETLAKTYGLPFVATAGNLGKDASEAAARKARYAFLHQVRTERSADALVTAHHQDDVLETMVLNMLRGTGRRGLSSLRSTAVVRRPLLHVTKKELLGYAKTHGLQWREDKTNKNEAYLRNYIRRKLMPRFGEADRQALLAVGHTVARLNGLISQEVEALLWSQAGADVLDRAMFTALPHAVAREVMAEWLLRRTSVELSRRLLERLVVAAKTGKNGSRTDVDGRTWLVVQQATLALEPKER